MLRWVACKTSEQRCQETQILNCESNDHMHLIEVKKINESDNRGGAAGKKIEAQE